MFVGRVERGEEIEDFVDDFGGAGLGLVDLVDRDNRLEAEFQRLADDEFCLRHRAFGGVNEDDDAIDHVQNTLDLATEIGVAGGIDDVDAGFFPLHRGAFGENGDAALALEIIRVHRAFRNLLVFAKRARLGEQLVDQGRLAVVNVRDNRDIPDIHKGPSRTDIARPRGKPGEFINCCSAHKGLCAKEQ